MSIESADPLGNHFRVSSPITSSEAGADPSPSNTALDNPAGAVSRAGGPGGSHMTDSRIELAKSVELECLRFNLGHQYPDYPLGSLKVSRLIDSPVATESAVRSSARWFVRMARPYLPIWLKSVAKRVVRSFEP